MPDGTVFVGIDCEVDEILAYQDVFSDIKKTGPLHITLKYLGYCTLLEQQQILALLERVHSPSFSFMTGALTSFRSPSRTRLLMLDVVHVKELHMLQQKVSRALLSMFTTERGFSPHITVARSKTPVNVATFPSMDPVRIRVERFCVYRKVDGQYVIIRSYPLD